MDRIAVLIPCWNEALTIRKVVTDFKRELPEAVIYVYDNNSTDDVSLALAVFLSDDGSCLSGNGSCIIR